MSTRLSYSDIRYSNHGTSDQLLELPKQDPCEFCEGMAGRDDTWAVIDECKLTLTVVNPYQYEIGQCCVITRRHAGTLLDLTADESVAVMAAAKRLALALVRTYRPLAVLTYQNNGVYSGQEVPHYHFHVVPRQEGSDWGIGPPQLATFPTAGRQADTCFDPADDAARKKRVRVAPRVIHDTAKLIRSNLPSDQNWRISPRPDHG